jgi:hypothetical protein
MAVGYVWGITTPNTHNPKYNTNDMSEELKHTPGPWHVDQQNVHVGQVCTCHGDMPGTWFEVWSANWGEGINQKANAHLIAAAPDLLEALKILATQAESHGAEGVYWDKARAAIAKAEGRAE